MAKKVARKVGEKKTTKPPQVKTLDERDTRPAERTVAEAEAQRTYADEKEAANAQDYRDSEPLKDDEVDKDRLPITHPTLITATDKGLPPEATPREGKSSPTPPIAVPVESDAARARRGQRKILVEATQAGYYDLIRRRPGDVFYISSETEFSKRWMRRARPGSQPSVSTPNQAIRQHHDAVLQGRMGMGNTNVTSGLDQAEEENPLDAD